MDNLLNICYAGLGGFIGAALRYILSLMVPIVFNSKFPVSTLIANIVGCFLLGIITESANKVSFLRPEIIIFLAVGICGGFTTFSSFMLENYNLIRGENILYTIFYGAISYIFGFIFLFLGIEFIKLILPEHV